MKMLVHEGNSEVMTIECSSYKIKLAGETLSLYAIHCIPPTSVLQFSGELTTLIEQDIIYIHGRVIPSPSMTCWKA